MSEKILLLVAQLSAHATGYGAAYEGSVTERKHLDDMRASEQALLKEFANREAVMWDLKRAIEQLQELIQNERPIPDKCCSCHIVPPCSDCSDHGHAREVMEQASLALKQFEEINK